MDIVKLVDFVKEGELFEKIEGEYQQIVSDFNFLKFNNIKGFIKIDKIGDFSKLDKSKSTLIILDKLLIDNVMIFLDMKEFTVLDMNFGLSGYGNKIGMSKIDLGDLIYKNISIYEPFDLVSMLSDLTLFGKKYIRINDFDLPGNFANGEIEDILSLSDHGFSGGAFTIISTGTMLPEIVRVAHVLNEYGLFVDLFVLNKLNFDLNEKWNNLLNHHKNIMFVLDSLNSSIYEKWIYDKLNTNRENLNEEGKLNIKFIYPKYEKLSTIFGEYKNEETLFDFVGLVERLK